MEADKLLKKHNLRVTGFRKEVLALFDQRSAAVDSRTIEQLLQPADRVTVYRTLRTFEDSGIIHRIPDSNGIIRFALCHQSCSDHAHNDSHAHFHCGTCDTTICLEDTEPVTVKTPSGFAVTETQIILSGTCASCNK